MKQTFIKKATRLFSTVALLSLAAAPLSAQEEGDYTILRGSLDFLAVKDFDISTLFTLEDGKPVAWNGEGLHTGNITCSFVMYNWKDIPESFDIPEAPAYSFICKDCYGDTAAEVQEDLTSSFKLIKFSNKVNQKFSNGFPILRGGVYKMQLAISPALYSSEQEIVLKDEAGVRIENTSVRADYDLNPIATITSGYPYDADTLTGYKTLRWTVTPAENPAEVVFEAVDVFEFDTSKPLLAAEVQLELTVPGLDPGEYIYTLTSDYAPACRTFRAHVNDVLKADVTLDKPLYTVGEDRVANLKIAMQYGYPYVAVNETTGLPTIFVKTILLDEENTEAFSDLAWENTDLDYTADVSVSLDNVTQKDIDGCKGELPLTVSIVFNYENQYEATVFIPFKYDNSGVEGVSTDYQHNSDIKYYNVFGVEVDSNYRGIILSSDGRKIIR